MHRGGGHHTAANNNYYNDYQANYRHPTGTPSGVHQNSGYRAGTTLFFNYDNHRYTGSVKSQESE